MKRLLTLLLLFMAVCYETGHAETFWTGTVFDGYGNSIANVMNFDWSSSGSGVAQGIGTSANPIIPGQQFTFRYQSYLFAYNAPDGQTLTPLNLNNNLNNNLNPYEYTIVAQFPEEVVSVTSPLPGITTATFRTLPGGLFYIYNDTQLNADVLSGFGFDDGTLVAKGTIDADQFSTFTSNLTNGTGIGSTVLNGMITYVNPAFLLPTNITGIRFESTLNLPPLDSSTSSFFVGRAGEGNITSYTVASNDLVLKVDGSSKFIQAPPPPGDCRVTAGGVKDGITVPCDLKNNGLPDPKTCAQAGFDTWGGQAGAQPGIDGNWTHHHFVSPSQSFLFHSNSLFMIGCSDPGCCVPACANAENHQIDFAGIGSFSNQKGYTFSKAPLCFEVHLEDIGEPGPGGAWPSSTDPCTHCPGTSVEFPDCKNCTDYYEILIYDSASYDTNGHCTGNVIYYNGPGVPANCTDPNDPHLFGYFTRSGNVQMHPQNN